MDRAERQLIKSVDREKRNKVKKEIEQRAEKEERICDSLYTTLKYKIDDIV